MSGKALFDVICGWPNAYMAGLNTLMFEWPEVTEIYTLGDDVVWMATVHKGFSAAEYSRVVWH